jgi:LysM repeat protein
MSFLVSTLLAFALAATVLAAALLVGLFPTGGGVAVASPRPSGSGAPISSISPGPSIASTQQPTVAATPPPATPLGPEGTTYEVQPGDSLSLIGEQFGIPWQLIAEANNIQGPDYVIVPGQVLTIPALPQATAGADVYYVLAGDTITGIAEQFGITPTALADYNSIADWNSIHPGDLLYIPTDSNATARPLPTD